MVTFTNSKGLKIVAYIDRPQESFDDKTFIIVPPSYGETKRQSLTLSYYLASNGFSVLRYDSTNHVGESAGEILDFTLPGAEDDLISAYTFLQGQYSIGSIGIVASSLAARVAIKAATNIHNIRILVCLVAVVDLRYTLNEVYHEDMIGTCINGRKWPVTDVLGFEVKGKFLETAIEYNFHNLESTIRDIQKLDCPVVFVCGEKDIWVNPKHTEMVASSSSHMASTCHFVSNGMHQLYENPSAAEEAIKIAVSSCLNTFRKGQKTRKDIYFPDLRDIARQSRIEKERQAKRKLTKEDEKAFWDKYLSKYVIIDRSNDYRIYLETMEKMLGEFTESAILLDVGCGPGYFGLWLLREIARNYFIKQPCIYVGVDFIDRAIHKAIHNYTILRPLMSQEKDGYIGPVMLNHVYLFEDIEALRDLNGNKLKINFQKESFDKILCSLFLSYVNNPEDVLKRLFSLLKKRGRIVVTSLKPHCDLSEVYRNFIKQAKGNEEIEEARKLLSAAGRIKLKEAEGQYKFFYAHELISMLNRAGGKKIEQQVSLAGQVNIIAAEK